MLLSLEVIFLEAELGSRIGQKIPSMNCNLHRTKQNLIGFHVDRLGRLIDRVVLYACFMWLSNDSFRASFSSNRFSTLVNYQKVVTGFGYVSEDYKCQNSYSRK